MKTFFTSDLHFGHSNIIIYDNRPFSSVDEMDLELIKRWNAKVSNEDTVYVIGDMFIGINPDYIYNILDSLNGNIVLIKGNHDNFAKKEQYAKYFQAIKDEDRIEVVLEDGTVHKCILHHQFFTDFDMEETPILLHGHSHVRPDADAEIAMIQQLNLDGKDIRAYNVGCMYYNYEPMTLDEIIQGGPKRRSTK